jgi:uncharacterized protein YhaN
MRFRSLAIPAYGPFTDLALEFPVGAADFHLIHGRNEAGKSSLLRAIRDLLYGIHVRTSDNFLHEYRDLRISAEIENRAGQRLAAQRRKGNSNTLLDAAGNPLADDALAPFLGAVDREFFTTMFGLGSEELRQGAHDLLQGKGDLGQALFSASLAGTPVHRVLDKLDGEARALFDGRAWKNVSIRPALDAYEEALRASRQAQVKPEAWEAVLRELAEAQTAKAEVDAALQVRRARQDWLQRCLDALPGLGRLDEAQARLDALPPPPDLPAGFAEAAGAGRDALAQAESRLDELRRRLAESSSRREALSPRAELLAGAAEIDALAADLAVYRQGREALAADRAEAARTRASLDTGLLDLGVEAGADIGALRIPLAEQLSLREAATALTEAEGAVEAQRREAERLADELEKTGRQLARLPGGEVAGLRAAHDAANAAAVWVDNSAALANLARRAVSQQQLLPGAPADPEAVHALALPAAARLRACVQAASELASRAKQLGEADKDAAKRLRDLKARLARLEQRGALPTPDDLVQARARRDDAWRQVLACWKDAAPEPERDGAPLSAAYPDTVRAADTLADRLREEADAVAQAEALRAAMREAEADARLREVDQTRLEQERKAWQEDWDGLWQPAGLTPGTPEEMLEWRDQWLEFRTRYEAWREARDEAQAGRAAIAAAVERLRPALEGAEGGLPGACRTLGSDSENRPRRGQFSTISPGNSRTIAQEMGEKWAGAVGLQPEIPKSDRLLELRELAERRLRAADQAVGERRVLEAREAELRDQGEALARQRPLRDAALERARAHWRAHRLGGEQRPESALGMLEARVDLVARHDAWSRLDAAITEKQQARDAFEARVSACATAAGIGPAAHAEVQVNTLVEALAEARKLRARRDQVEEDLARLTANLPEAERESEAARRDMAALLARAGVADPAALQALLTDLAVRHGLVAERDRLRAGLHAQARGEPLDDFIERVREEDGATLATERADLAEQIHEWEGRREQIIQALARAEDAKAHLESSGDGAAEHLQTARHAAARVRQDAARYLRLRLATRFLRGQIEAFRARNQGPLLAGAGALFRKMTGASFSGLGTAYAEDDTPILVGLKNGVGIPLDGMSEGTRDQLYLALRLAAIEQHQINHEPMPLILDDLLITFDDDRCRAILPLLRDLAGHTQVLLFTHHQHLIDLAREVLPAESMRLHRLGAGYDQHETTVML